MSKTKVTHTTENEPLDLLIIGAGISGIDIAHHINNNFPHWNWAVIDSNSDLGGTWNTFTYPGIRSDSDMATFAFPFKPWPHPNTLGSAQQIRDYIREAATEANVLPRLTLNTWVKDINFHTTTNLWEITALQAPHGTNNAEGRGAGASEQKEITIWATRVHFAGGYYRHSSGYTAPIPGLDSFAGTLIHPQRWPEDLDVRGKKCVIIGSGATAITLLPALHNMGAHTTMLQRTPTYVAALPNTDKITTALKPFGRAGIRLARNLHIYRDMAQYHLCQTFPRIARGIFWLWNRTYLPSHQVNEHFRPPYNPWDQRVCKSPDADFFHALNNGAQIITSAIQRVEAEGIRLSDGTLVQADVVIVATGLELQFLGGTSLRLDGQVCEQRSLVSYRGLMLSDVPNLTFTLGYLNQSWTLRADMTSQYLVRLWKHMEAHGLGVATPVLPEGAVADQPILDWESGYIQRSVESLPRQGKADPWVITQDYVSERKVIEHGDVLVDMVFKPA